MGNFGPCWPQAKNIDAVLERNALFPLGREVGAQQQMIGLADRLGGYTFTSLVHYSAINLQHPPLVLPVLSKEEAVSPSSSY